MAASSALPAAALLISAPSAATSINSDLFMESPLVNGTVILPVLERFVIDITQHHHEKMRFGIEIQI
jgi:hypothetical protein